MRMDIRVILADDHAVVRDGLRSIIDRLGERITITGEASDGKQCLDLAKESPADVYILDIAMPVLNGIETTEKLLKMLPYSKVVILSMYNDKVLVERAFKRGAHGYVLKESAAEEIVRAIREVHRGRYYISPSISGYVVEGFKSWMSEYDADRQEHVLTPRQREVLKFICEGYTEKEIAGVLNLSPYTVHVHKGNIMAKLGLHSTAELVRYAIKTGIVPL
jgi:DNA-binding NarL/FixJ family response regulator